MAHQSKLSVTHVHSNCGIGKEDDGEVIPPTAPESRTPETGPEEAILAEQSAGDGDSSLLPSGGGRRAHNACRADLLFAAAARIAQLEVEEPEEDAAREQRAGSSTVTVVQESLPAKFDLQSVSRFDMPSLKKQLPFVREFVAAGGDWTAFQRRFAATRARAGLSDEEALRALPTTLDDDALVAFDSIPPADRATLPQAYTQLAAISSNRVVRGFALVGAQTIVRGDQELFLQVLNIGVGTTVVQAEQRAATTRSTGSGHSSTYLRKPERGRQSAWRGEAACLGHERIDKSANAARAQRASARGERASERGERASERARGASARGDTAGGSSPSGARERLAKSPAPRRSVRAEREISHARPSSH
ncbi:unnamed protein product [Lampetra planeri]